MKKNTNWLANLFNSLGEVFERFNPAAFRFLAAFLPYLTPFPVAWISQANATKFLNLPTEVSFILVFGLEGIGLWFTSLLVDSIVTAIRSKNWKAWIIVVILAVIVAVYIDILVNLNVIIEQSSGQTDPAYSRVITLLCFLPLITGVGNGYYKLTLDSKTNIELAQQRQTEWEQEQWKTKETNKQQVRLAKAGINPLAPIVNYNKEIDTVSEKKHQASDYKDLVFELFAQYGDLPLTEITTRVNKAKRVQLIHDEVKGTWFKYKTQWKRSQT